MLEKEENYSEMSLLKDEIKSKENNKKLEKNETIYKEKESLKLLGNDFNDLRPKFYGKTKSILFIGETPILILGEDCNFYNY